MMLYFARLITPPGGVILDPFMGSGTTGIGAILGGFDFIGIDQDLSFVELSEKRINYAIENPRSSASLTIKRKTDKIDGVERVENKKSPTKQEASRQIDLFWNTEKKQD